MPKLVSRGSGKNIQAFQKELFNSRAALALLGLTADNTWWIDPVNGSDGFDGKAVDFAFATIQKAVDLAEAGDYFLLLPGQYDETVTISRTGGASSALSKLTFIGVGGKGSAYIEPSTEDADGVICHADDVTFVNVGIAAEDETAGNLALDISGSRFRAYQCKIEGGEDQISIGPGTVAQEAAGSRGVGADALFQDCEICWGTNGIDLVCTDYGAVTQLRVVNCLFHNLTGSHVKETLGSGGSAAVGFRDVWFYDCAFSDAEDGTPPTKFFDLNDDNANTGLVTRCSFPTALAGGLNLVSTAMHWVSNYHTGGISTTQPS